MTESRESTKSRNVKLPDRIWDGLARIARDNDQILKGHGFTGQPNRTWALTTLVEAELARMDRRAAKAKAPG